MRLILKKIVILGSGGFAREACLHVLDCFEKIEIVFYDDFAKNSETQVKEKIYQVYNSFNSLKNDGFEKFIVGVGIPASKKILTVKAIEQGLIPHETIIHPRALIQDAQIGRGGLICPGVMVTTNVTIQDYVVLNLNSTVGHDSTIGTYVTCNPGSSVSGKCIIHEGVYFGVGAATKEGVDIAKDVTIGGQAFVTKTITTPNSTWIGIPAKQLNR